MKIQAIKNKLIVKLGGFTKQEVLQIAPPEIREPMQVRTIQGVREIDDFEMIKINSLNKDKIINNIKEGILINLAIEELEKYVEWKEEINPFNHSRSIIGRIKIVEVEK